MAKRKDANVEVVDSTDSKPKRSRLVRNFPALSFEETFNFAKKILEFGSGSPVRRLSIFDHIGRSPESSASRVLIISAGKYGLIKGGVQADQLELTPVGLKAVSDQSIVSEQKKAKFSAAIESIEPFKLLYGKFVGNKLPAKGALKDVVVEAGASVDSADELVDMFITNLEFIGMLQTLSGSQRILSFEHFLSSVDIVRKSDDPTTFFQVPISIENKSFPLMTSETADFEKTCFYVTPIGADDSEQRLHSDLFLGQLVEPALAPLQLTVVRADGIQRSGAITKQILQYVLYSRLVIVDLSFHNPNVFYELAVRHATGKPVVQIVRKGDPIPFDINQQRTIVIDNTSIYTLMPKQQTYISEIAAQARSALNDEISSDNPINTYFPNIKLQ